MVKVGESKELEAEIQLLKSENAELRRKVSETAALETAKKRAEDKVEAIENKVRYSTEIMLVILNSL
jgi:homeobox protein cut-like